MRESELKAFLKGDGQLFEDRDALDSLYERVRRWVENADLDNVEIAVKRLGEGLLSVDPTVQPNIAQTVGRVGSLLVSEGEMMLLYRLSQRVVVWIILETRLTLPYDQICDQLRALAIHLILDGRFAESDHILESFYIIRTGKLKKAPEIQSRAARLLDEIATDEVLDVLLDEFQTDARGNRPAAIDCLLHLGTASAGPLLGLLRWSPSRYERARILQILSFIGRQAVPALVREIGKDQPWFYLRNVVQLLGKMGDPHHMEILQPLLDHKDIRVQREALHAIHRVGGAQSEEMALTFLPTADDRLKGDVAQVLGALRSEKAVPLLLQILESDATQTVEELGERICEALGRIGSSAAVPTLNRIIESTETAAPAGERLRAAAAEALARTQEKTGQTKAVRLTPKQEHMKLWAGLYDMLTPKEGDIFFASLVEMDYSEEELIIRQGEMNRRLFFIEEGELVLAYDQEGEEIWVKTLRPGDIAGGESFFSASVTTTSLRAVTAVRLHKLGKDDLNRRFKRFPDLEEKLKSYCYKTGNIRTILKRYGMERRIDQRAEITARVSIQFLGKDDRPERKTIRGDLLDISAGGLSTLVTVPGEEAALFVGKRINVKLLLPLGSSPLEIDQNGGVVAVFPKNNGEAASVHMKFDWRLTRMLDLDTVLQIEAVAEDFEEKASFQQKDDFLITRLPE